MKKPSPFPDYIATYITTYPSGSLNPVSGGGTLNLSNATTTTISSVGTVIGNFSVTGGSTRTYTYTLTSNPGGLFSVGGSTLAVAAALSQGSDPITAQANDGNGSIITAPFLITVISTAVGATGSLTFNNVNNSMYIPLLGGLG